MSNRKKTVLTERDNEVAAMRRAGSTLMEIGHKFGLTRARVKQICDAAGVKPPEKPRLPENPPRSKGVSNASPERPPPARRGAMLPPPPEMPPEIKAAYDEGRKMMADIKADWDRKRDAAYEVWYNDPAVAEQDEKAHSLLDKVAEWERQFAKPKDEKCLDMTADKIAGKPRPKGARPIKTWIAWDCRDAAMIRDEAIFRGITSGEVERRFVESLLRDIRKVIPSSNI